MESDDINEKENMSELHERETELDSDPIETSAKSPQKSPWKAFILTGLIASLFGAAGGGYGVFTGLKSQKPNTAAAPAVDLSPLEAKLKNLTIRLEAAEASVKKSAARPTSTGKPVDLSAIEKRLDRLEATPKIEAGDLSGLEKRLDTLEDAPSPEIDPAALTALQSAQKDGFEWPDTSDLEERIQALEAKLDDAREPSVPTDLLDRLETLEADVETAQSENGFSVLNEELEARLTALENRPAGPGRIERVSILAFPKEAMVAAVEDNIEGGLLKKTLSRHVRIKDENDPIALIEGIEADIAKGRLEGAADKFDRLPEPIRAAGQAWYDSVKASL